MKFTITSFTLFATTALSSRMNHHRHRVQAVIAPEVVCCTDNGGTYETMDGGVNGPSGICIKNGNYVAAMVFMDRKCSPGRYQVYAYNSCDATVGAEFTLNDDYYQNVNNKVCVFIRAGECKAVGVTDQVNVIYEETGSLVSGGQYSCANNQILSSNNDQCGDLDLPANACVVDLC